MACVERYSTAQDTPTSTLRILAAIVFRLIFERAVPADICRYRVKATGRIGEVQFKSGDEGNPRRSGASGKFAPTRLGLRFLKVPRKRGKPQILIGAINRDRSSAGVALTSRCDGT